MSGLSGTSATSVSKEQTAKERRLMGLSAFDRHQWLMKDAIKYYRAKLPPEQQTLKSDYDVLKEQYRYAVCPSTRYACCCINAYKSANSHSNSCTDFIFYNNVHSLRMAASSVRVTSHCKFSSAICPWYLYHRHCTQLSLHSASYSFSHPQSELDAGSLCMYMDTDQFLLNASFRIF